MLTYIIGDPGLGLPFIVVPALLKVNRSARKKHGLKLEMILKVRDIYFESTIVSLIASLKIEGFFKWKGLKLQGLLHMYLNLYLTCNGMHVHKHAKRYSDPKCQCGCM